MRRAEAPSTKSFVLNQHNRPLLPRPCLRDEITHYGIYLCDKVPEGETEYR